MVGKINFVGVKTEVEPIPDGIYECSFVSYKFGKTGNNSKNPGEDKVDLQFAVTGNVPGDEPYKNRRLFRTCTFGADSLWAFKRTMMALGADVNWEDEDGIDPDEVCRSVMNNLCLVKTTIEESEIEDPVTKQPTKRANNRVHDVQPTDATRVALAEAAQTLPEAEPAHNGRGRR